MHALRFRSAQSNRESEGANDRPVQTHFCKSESSCSRRASLACSSRRSTSRSNGRDGGRHPARSHPLWLAGARHVEGAVPGAEPRVPERFEPGRPGVVYVPGRSLNPKELHEHRHAAVLTSHVSIVTPFCLGSLTALFLYPRLSDDSVSFMGFALFMGAAMSITAFPVLARILTERDLLRSRMGTLAIACAAVDDVTGWCILAYVVLLVRTEDPTSMPMPLWLTVGGLGMFLLAMLYGVKPLLYRFETVFRRRGQLTDNMLA